MRHVRDRRGDVGVHSVATAAAPAPIDGADGVVSQNRLGIGTAQAAAQAALAKCQADGLGFVTVSVVDRAGNVQAMLRGDNAAQHTVEAARQKAYTAAAFGANTSDLSDRAKGDGATVADLPGTLFLAGGVSVKSADGSIAGIGVGGAPDGMRDQAVRGRRSRRDRRGAGLKSRPRVDARTGARCSTPSPVTTPPLCGHCSTPERTSRRAARRTAPR